MKILNLYYTFLDILSGQGFLKSDCETPQEYALNLSKKGVLPESGLNRFIGKYLEARFSLREIGADDISFTEETFRLLKEHLLSGR